MSWGPFKISSQFRRKVNVGGEFFFRGACNKEWFGFLHLKTLMGYNFMPFKISGKKSNKHGYQQCVSILNGIYALSLSVDNNVLMAHYVLGRLS